jgi:hypothetical protein
MVHYQMQILHYLNSLDLPTCMIDSIGETQCSRSRLQIKYDLEPCNHYTTATLVISTMHNMIDLNKKAFPIHISESRTQARTCITQSDIANRDEVYQFDRRFKCSNKRINRHSQRRTRMGTLIHIGITSDIYEEYMFHEKN